MRAASTVPNQWLPTWLSTKKLHAQPKQESPLNRLYRSVMKHTQHIQHQTSPTTSPCTLIDEYMFLPASSQTLPHNPQGPAHMDKSGIELRRRIASWCSSNLRMCWTIHSLINFETVMPSVNPYPLQTTPCHPINKVRQYKLQLQPLAGFCKMAQTG